MAFGTPIYMAPEQALGAPMDGRADLYAAAVVGYEMLAGQPPFYSDDKLEVMSMHTAKPVPPIRQRLGKGGKPVPSSIEKLVVRGLTKKPSDRYANADDFLAAVEDALSTKDGGNTDIEFEKPSSTGSQPLVTETGSVRITGDSPIDDGAEPNDDSGAITGIEDGISAAIDEALASASAAPAAPVASVNPRASAPHLPRRTSTPGAGLPPQQPPARPTGSAPALPPPRTGSAPALPQPPRVGSSPALPLQLHAHAHARPPQGPPQGGVGIGLPYTGPTGEPIFGLTPEQRLASAAAPPPAAPVSALATGGFPQTHPTGVAPKLARKRWPLYAAGAGIAIAAGIVIGLATTHHSPAHAEMSPAATAATEAVARGDVDGAIRLLEGQRAAIASDAPAPL